MKSALFWFIFILENWNVVSAFPVDNLLLWLDVFSELLLYSAY